MTPRQRAQEYLRRHNEAVDYRLQELLNTRDPVLRRVIEHDIERANANALVHYRSLERGATMDQRNEAAENRPSYEEIQAQQARGYIQQANILRRDMERLQAQVQRDNERIDRAIGAADAALAIGAPVPEDPMEELGGLNEAEARVHAPRAPQAQAGGVGVVRVEELPAEDIANPQNVAELRAVQNQAQAAAMGNKVGFAQRTRHKILRKIEGMATKMRNLNQRAPQWMNNQMVRIKDGNGNWQMVPRRISEIKKLRTEMATLRADLYADRFDEFLTRMTWDTYGSYYRRNPLGQQQQRIYEAMPMRLTNYDRTGITRYPGQAKR